MNKKSFFLRNVATTVACLAVLTLFSGCGKDKADDPKPITVANNGQLTQTVFADKTEGASGVNITTTGAWTSSISETAATRASAPAWISISPDNGDKAGQYNIVITLVPNTTGADRTAVITISCEGTEITITVTQKKEKEDGTIPTDLKLVKRIDEFESDTASVAYSSTSFEYDSENRLVKILSNGGAAITSIVYAANTVRIDFPWDESVTYSLNSAGYVEDSGTETWSYDGNGYLSRQQNKSDAESYNSYTWQNGNLKSYVCKSVLPNDSHYITETISVEYGALLNKNCGIDLAQFVAVAGLNGSSYAPIYDLFGKSVKNLPSRAEVQPWDGIFTYSYETDANGYITKITAGTQYIYKMFYY